MNKPLSTQSACLAEQVATLLFGETEVADAAHAEMFRLLRRIIAAGMAALEAEAQDRRSRMTFRQALEARLKRCERRRPCTVADLRSYAQRFLRYGAFADKPLQLVQAAECRELLEAHFAVSSHVYRKAYAALHSVFCYGRRQGWCDRLPTAGLELPPVQESTVVPLTLPQINALLRVCRLEGLAGMNAPLRLMIWCGIRPMEVRRLCWGDIDQQEGCVYVEARASKTGGARAIPLRGGARALLRERHAAEERIAPRDWVRLWQRVRRAACLRCWQQDALRHTFASMHLKHFHNLNLLQEEMGHRDSRLLRTRYLNLRNVRAEAARQFFTCYR